jgi:hypothetical protein
MNATAERVKSSMEIASDVRIDMRNIMYPTIPILLFAALVAFVVLLKRDEDAVGSKLEKLLLGVGAFQAVLAVLCLFAFQDGVVFMQFIFSAIVTLFYSLQPERTLVGQFVAIVSVVNFFCILGLFPLLGYSGFTIDQVVNSATCIQYYGLSIIAGDPPSLDPQCAPFLNVITFAGITLACLQPISALFSYLLFSNHDVLTK